jgi:LPXTG-site transpeptidase (sortase) family protein
MEFKLSLKWSLFVLGATGILLAVFLRAFDLPLKRSSALPFSPVGQINAGFPVRLKIPSINIDTIVEQVGLTPAGAMDVPRQPDDVAWFDLGPRPGQKGSAVIDGHSGWKDNRPAVFDNLSKLREGDKIYVEDDKGATTIFVVQKFKTYAPNQDVSDVFSSSDDQAHLNLITCSGSWDNTEQTHSTRLVVFADLLSP